MAHALQHTARSSSNASSAAGFFEKYAALRKTEPFIFSHFYVSLPVISTDNISL